MNAHPNHYATLGLDRECTETQIRSAYRLLAKQYHPDVNHGSASAQAHTQALNAAYEVLSDPDRRREYDRELAAPKKGPPRSSAMGRSLVTQDVQLRLEDFLRGITLDVRINDPGNPDGPETYQLIVPPETAPGTRFKLARSAAPTGGAVTVRVRAQPGFQFKVRGSDLRCDLKIKTHRAAQGGSESVRGLTGNYLRVQIPVGIARGAVLRIANEGLPKPRGGRGDLLVRVTYVPEVRVTRASGR